MDKWKVKWREVERFTENEPLNLRFQRTLAFLEATCPPPARILDIGTPNTLGEIMSRRGYQVRNTPLVDLDEEPQVVAGPEVDVVTAFEILEHLVCPLGVLRAISAPRLIATVPLRLWFDTAYYNPKEPWDRHFHEFEPWQFDWLLEKAGWKIVRREKWNSPPRWIVGVRPFLRFITPRYYAVEAVRA